MKTSICFCLAALAAAGCASGPKPTAERGWIGGRFADVTRNYRPEITDGLHGAVVGMPDSAPGDAGALVTAARDGSPLARAGLHAGDLLLSIDGEPTEGALELRERVEDLAPGSHAQATYWRAGEVRTAEIVVGRETYESSGRIQIGLGLSSTLDLWPFDDGINVLGLVRIGKDHARHDLDDAVTAYRREIDPEAEIVSPQQEMFEVFIVPFGVAKGKRVLRQETVP